MNYYNPNYYTGTGYPYLNNQYMQTQPPQQQQMQPQPQMMPNGLNGKIVDGPEMVRATEVPIGGYAIFPKADLSEIYIKAWNQNGTTNIITFKPIIPENVAPAQEKDNVSQILQRIDLLENKIDSLIMEKGAAKKEVNANGF